MSLNEAMFKLLWFMSIVIIVWMLVVSIVGCSSVEAINTEASDIDRLAQSSETRFITIADLSDVDEIDTQAKYGVTEQQEIQDSVANIRKELPRVEDKSPDWMVMIERLSIAGILIAIIILIWQTGIGNLIKRLLYSVSWFIPSASKRQVEMDLKVADHENEMTMREVIAHRRSDPAYDSAYKLNRRKKP